MFRRLGGFSNINLFSFNSGGQKFKTTESFLRPPFLAFREPPSQSFLGVTASLLSYIDIFISYLCHLCKACFILCLVSSFNIIFVKSINVALRSCN